MSSGFDFTEDEKRARAMADLRLGLPIGVSTGAVMAIEHLAKARYEALSDAPRFVILSKQRAFDLKLTHDPSRDVCLRLPADYPFEKLKALADPALGLDYPGKGPLAQAEGFGEISDCLAFCRAARTLPALLFVAGDYSNLHQFAPDWARRSDNLNKVTSARVPLALAPDAELHVFHAPDTDEDHCAITIRASASTTPNVRVHSACLTGDCFGSLKCDCGPQLHQALRILNETGGVLLYMSQEGRGIGLANKIRAYRLQDQGYDTVEANEMMGFADDERHFDIAAKMLKSLNFNEINLITNNPRKIALLQNEGVAVKERIPLVITPNEKNRAYLSVKAKKSGHLL